MSTYREELEKYVEQQVPDVTADLSERSGGRNGYGYLLQNVHFPNGEYIDHCWVGGGEGMGCARWAEGTVCLGQRIKFTAFVDKYFSAGAERRGNYGAGIGIAGIDDVKVWVNGEWLPIDEGVKNVRQEKSAALKLLKASPEYVWPGSWTYVKGVARVKAAKSAAPDAYSYVRSKSGDVAKVILVSFDLESKTWDWKRTPEDQIKFEAELEAGRKRDEAAAKRQAEDVENTRRRQILQKFLALRTQSAKNRYVAAEPWLSEQRVESKR